MVNGLGSQCTNYKDEWCEMFVGAGLHVIRFDNRDVGLSTSFADAPVDEHGAAYRLHDMADDAIAVLDACGVEQAHVMGLSMGGMIVQTMAIEHPERLLSMTSVMSTTGEPEYMKSSPEAYAVLTGPPATDRESLSSANDRRPARVRQPGVRRRGALAGEPPSSPSTARSRPTGRAASSSPSARPDRGPTGCARSTMPTLVIHGSADTLIDPIGGRRTAELVPGARFELIDGMGHDYPPQLWERWVDLVAGHVFASAAVTAADVAFLGIRSAPAERRRSCP